MTEEQIRSWISFHIVYQDKKRFCSFTESSITIKGNRVSIKVNKNQMTVWARNTDINKKFPFDLVFIVGNIRLGFWGIHPSICNFRGMTRIIITGQQPPPILADDSEEVET